MDSEAYLKDRVQDQIDYFQSKSAMNKKRYNWIQVFTILFGILIPLLTGYSDHVPQLKYVVAILGTLIALFAGLQSQFRYKDHWTQTRVSAEALIRERFLYQTKAGIYHASNEPFKLFVEEVENILGSENKTWMAQVQKDKAE